MRRLVARFLRILRMHNGCTTVRVSEATRMRRVVARFLWIQIVHNECTTVRVSETMSRVARWTYSVTIVRFR